MHSWRKSIRIWLPALALLVVALACSAQAPEHLNQGKGTRDDPVAARKYGKTPSFEVRVLSVVRPMDATPAVQQDNTQTEYMKVQFGIKCSKDKNSVCDLGKLRDSLKVVSTDGVIYDPLPEVPLEEGDRPLEGEILGGAEQAGWVAYQVPVGLTVTLAIAEYGEDQRIFLKMP